jgi:N-acetylglucosaminyldiphosphoundecaprenol N-acetyl-beta-D-mannosaminyltransferase
LQLGKIKIILYADFNVINYLYEKKIKVPPNILLYPDSTAMNIALRLRKKAISKLVSTDLQEKILSNANQQKLKIFFFGDKQSVLEKLKEKISTDFPKLIPVGFNKGYGYDTDCVVNRINKAKPDILFVGLGVGRQEPWIFENANKLDVPLIMTVGGWFNFLAGTKKRAPEIFRKIHLEWFYKIMTDFKRLWRRYLFGIPQFFFRVLFGKIQFEIVDQDG